ncbi:electron transfer flavoprotein subunit alpha/FixB family protein [Serratia fonticola]|uniref:electron transfer flavoprotein subunit alpha/FixB family protein n=1 Tax=Serratia fonticola TaxID=47917 RepID=UPI0015C623E9|nr:electron transfer flavoprotein subunit alpha/FixB family protein [Serratia fonticola]MBC3378150.1 electron transfer flavoprotein subunit alpha/FixB family protein [Serratia fonticola]NYA37350.1 electron transfer flavoprotein subunit alpha/FixB family protein [Serratia fonticola]
MMNIALILDADAPNFATQASQINQFLRLSELTAESLELWLFSNGIPQSLPCLDGEVVEIRWVSAPRLAETRLAVLEQMRQAFTPRLLLFAGDEGGELATRLACRSGGSACCAVELAHINGSECRVTKAVYGNHITAELMMMREPWCLSVARSGVVSMEIVPGPVVAKRFEPTNIPDAEWILASVCSPQPAASPLSQARYVLAIGEGVGSAGQVAHMQQLATRIGAELAASRPVVMNAWCEMDRLLGMSGAIIAPEVCIAAGISGAPAFAIGIRHSKLIVAINQDPQAAIFAQADVGIVGDMHEVLETLTNAL